MVVVGAVGVIGRMPKSHVFEKQDAIILPSFSAGFHAVAAVRRRVLSSRTCWPPSALALRRELEWRRCRSLLTATFSRACVAVVSLESVARRRALCPPSGTRHAPRACWGHRGDIVCRPRIASRTLDHAATDAAKDGAATEQPADLQGCACGALSSRVLPAAPSGTFPHSVGNESKLRHESGRLRARVCRRRDNRFPPFAPTPSSAFSYRTLPSATLSRTNHSPSSNPQPIFFRVP